MDRCIDLEDVVDYIAENHLTASHAEHIQILNEFIHSSPKPVDATLNDCEVLFVCQDYGLFDLAREVLVLFKDQLPSTAECIGLLLYYSFGKADIDMLRVMLEVYGEEICGQLFKKACLRGDLGITEMVIDSYRAVPGAAIPMMFMYACGHGDHELLDLLLIEYGDTIEPMICFKAFDFACEGGYIDIAQLLVTRFSLKEEFGEYTSSSPGSYRLSSDYSFDNQLVCRSSEMVKWLDQEFNTSLHRWRRDFYDYSTTKSSIDEDGIDYVLWNQVKLYYALMYRCNTQP